MNLKSWCALGSCGAALWTLIALAGELSAAERQLGGRTFYLAEGYELEIAALGPVTQYPVFGCFDGQGRLYVGEASGARDWKEAQPADKQEFWHRLVRLTDTDGDGTFDRREEIARFDRPLQGVQCLGGSTVFVASPPCIWKLVDADLDGRFETREKWYEQASPLTNCLNDLHGPVLGPDGWLYFTKGAGSEIEFGTSRAPHKSQARHLLRRHPAGGLIESVMNGGMDNPVETCFTRGGERLLTATNFQIMGTPRRDGVIHALIGALVPKDIGEGFGFPWTTPEFYDHPIFDGGAMAVAGIARCEGAHWPDRVFVTQFSGRRVTALSLSEERGTYVAIASDVLTTDDSVFHPTDVIEDADGSLLILDTGGWYLHCCPSSTFFRPDATGGIYRLRRTGAPPVHDPRGLKLDWTEVQPDVLASRLCDWRPAVRQRAQERLVTLGDDAIPALVAMKSTGASGSTSLGREAAVWIAAQIIGNQIARHGAPMAAAIDYLRTALSDGDANVRLAAINALSLHFIARASQLLIERLQVDESSLCRRAAAEALGRLRCKESVAAILAALAREDGGPALDHSLGLALIEIADTRSMQRALSHSHPKVRRAALMTLEQTATHVLNPASVLPLVESTEAMLRRSAWWVIARHTWDWGAEIATALRSRFSDDALDESIRREYAENLGAVAGSPEIQTFLAAELLRPNVPEPTRILILSAMAVKRGGGGIPAWWDAALQVVRGGHGSQRLVESAAATLAAMPKIATNARTSAAEREQHSQRVATILKAAADERLPLTARLGLVQSVTGALENPPDAQFDFLVAAMRCDQPIAMRASAADSLARWRLTARQKESLAGCLDGFATAELNRLLECFRQCSDAAIGERIVASLERSPAALSISPVRIENLLAAFDPAVRRKAEPLLSRLAAADREQLQRFEVILSLLPEASDERGLGVFQSKRFSCQNCHVAVLAGGNVGPSLRGLGKRRSERDILESIVFPSASIAQGYETWRAALADGRVLEGVLLADRRDLVRLGTARTIEMVARHEIEQLSLSPISLMPAGIDRTMTDQELADLLAYLKSL